MNLQTGIRRVLIGVLGVVVLAVLLGSLLGQPILLSFVETGSMSPTLEAGDGFVAVPAAIAGPVETGDVVVFQAETLHGGGLVTHRVVGDTERGYLTQGDANVATDQSGDEEPPVKDEQVVAVALQVDGEVVVIPGLGDAIGMFSSGVGLVQQSIASVSGVPLQGGQGVAILLLVVMIVWYGFEVWRERNTSNRNRKREQARETTLSGHTIVLGLVALVVLGATLAMVVPSGTTEYNVVSAEFDSDGSRVIPVGETETTTHSIGNGGVLPAVVFLEPSDSNIDVERSSVALAGRSGTNVSVSVTAPPETGYYRHFVTEHRYIGVLPTPVLEWLYHIHPWVPIVVIDALVAVPYYLVGIRLIGTRSVRVQRRKREKPVSVRVRRTLRKLY